VSRKMIKGNITRKGKVRVWSTRKGIACVCAHSPQGIGRRQE
jgi:hypothetical protein